jgi:hypothetical protein
MADLSKPRGNDPIPESLSEAFGDAVGCYFVSWSPGDHGREISIDGKPFTIDAICRLVMSFTDRLPDNLLDRLLDAGDVREDGLKADLVQERTYAAGAKLLLGVMDQRVREYQHRETLLR